MSENSWEQPHSTPDEGPLLMIQSVGACSFVEMTLEELRSLIIVGDPFVVTVGERQRRRLIVPQHVIYADELRAEQK